MTFIGELNPFSLIYDIERSHDFRAKLENSCHSHGGEASLRQTEFWRKGRCCFSYGGS